MEALIQELAPHCILRILILRLLAAVQAAAGRLIGDGRAELLLVQPDNRARMFTIFRIRCSVSRLTIWREASMTDRAGQVQGSRAQIILFKSTTIDGDGTA